jgi:Cu-Zn family superoxide dismutase
MRKTMLSTALVLVLAACGSPESDETAPAEPAAPTPTPTVRAVAVLRTADGADAGTATATPGLDSVRIALSVTGLPPGEHGVHVHTTGACEAPTFESAGGHWNPGEAMHGLEGEAGQHAGDMPNLTVAEDGTGSLNYQLIGGDWEGLLDADGSAFVVHAMPDDQETDPSGNSGERIACGVFSAG